MLDNYGFELFFRATHASPGFEGPPKFRQSLRRARGTHLTRILTEPFEQGL